MYISSYQGLVNFCERASAHKVLAVNTEFLRERTYHPLLCLIQVATSDEIAAIDPLEISELEPLADLLADERSTKVFHACDQDLEVIHDALDIVPAPVFDTQLAAAFLGNRMQMGLGAVVQQYCGVHLAKADGLTDWSRRPLDAEQLRYAEDDVRYLGAIYDTMMRQLVDRDRLAWFTPEMEALADPGRLSRNPREMFRHLRRSSSLTRKQLAVAREICEWREHTAERRNLPRKWVLSDEVVVELAKRAPEREERLRRIRGTESLSSHDASALVAAIRRGVRCAPDDYPEVHHRVRPSAQTDSVVNLMYAMLRLISEKCGVAIPLLATRDDLYAFAAGEQGCALAEGWRHEVVGTTLQGLLAGEVGLTVKDGRIEML